MNTTLIIHLLVEVFRLVFGHHFATGWGHPGFYVPDCFGTVRVQGGVRQVCGIIHVWPHGALIRWR